MQHEHDNPLPRPREQDTISVQERFRSMAEIGPRADSQLCVVKRCTATFDYDRTSTYAAPLVETPRNVDARRAVAQPLLHLVIIYLLLVEREDHLVIKHSCNGITILTCGR